MPRWLSLPSALGPTLVVTCGIVTSAGCASTVQLGPIIQAERPRAPTGDFSSISSLVRKGDVLTITDVASRETRGRLFDLGADSLTLADGQSRRVFHASDIAQIQRRGDSIINGTLLGAGIAGLLGVLSTTLAESEQCEGSYPGCDSAVVLGIFLGAMVGAGVDAAIRGRTTVYRRHAAVRRIDVGVLPARGVFLNFRVPVSP